MNPTELESAPAPTPHTPARKPFVEPQLTEKGEFGEVTAGNFGPMSP